MTCIIILFECTLSYGICMHALACMCWRSALCVSVMVYDWGSVVWPAPCGKPCNFLCVVVVVVVQIQTKCHCTMMLMHYCIIVDTCMSMSCVCKRVVCVFVCVCMRLVCVYVFVCMCLFGIWSMGQEAQALLPLLLRRGDHHPARDELHKVCACIVQRLCILSVI